MKDMDYVFFVFFFQSTSLITVCCPFSLDYFGVLNVHQTNHLIVAYVFLFL
jgi:hypothetical protein